MKPFHTYSSENGAAVGNKQCPRPCASTSSQWWTETCLTFNKKVRDQLNFVFHHFFQWIIKDHFKKFRQQFYRNIFVHYLIDIKAHFSMYSLIYFFSYDNPAPPLSTFTTHCGQWFKKFGHPCCKLTAPHKAWHRYCSCFHSFTDVPSTQLCLQKND